MNYHTHKKCFRSVIRLYKLLELLGFLYPEIWLNQITEKKLTMNLLRVSILSQIAKTIEVEFSFIVPSSRKHIR